MRFKILTKFLFTIHHPFYTHQITNLIVYQFFLFNNTILYIYYIACLLTFAICKIPKEFPIHQKRELLLKFSLAGPQGFEPWNDGVRVRCLTIWRWANMLSQQIILYIYPRLVSSIFLFNIVFYISILFFIRHIFINVQSFQYTATPRWELPFRIVQT